MKLLKKLKTRLDDVIDDLDDKLCGFTVGDSEIEEQLLNIVYSNLKIVQLLSNRVEIIYTSKDPRMVRDIEILFRERSSHDLRIAHLQDDQRLLRNSVKQEISQIKQMLIKAQLTDAIDE